MGGLNSAQKKFLIILTIVTVISIVLTVLAYQLVPSLRPQTATNDPAGTPTATTITDTPTPTPTVITPTPTPHKKPTPTPTPVRPTPTPTPKPPVTITILIQNSTNNAFKQKTVTVPRGSTIIFKNISQIPHTATETSGPATFDTGNINPGQSKSIKLTKPGTYHYDCTYHPNMVGTIIVE
jgi:plastocyanin